MSPRKSNSESEQTRNRILQSAHTLFLKQGYHGTTMRQIGTDAGVTMGGIYNHFVNKEQIFTAVFIDNHPFYEILPLLASAQGDTIEAIVHDAAHRMITSLGKRTDLLNLMFIELVEFNGKHIQSLFIQLYPQMLNLAQNFLSKKGNLRPIPLPSVTRAFTGLFFSYYITGQMMSFVLTEDPERHTLEDFVNIFLYGILTSPVRED